MLEFQQITQQTQNIDMEIHSKNTQQPPHTPFFCLAGCHKT